MFVSNATAYSTNTLLQLKMCLLVVAFCNVLVFHFILERNIEHWEEVSLRRRPCVPAPASSSPWLRCATENCGPKRRAGPHLGPGARGFTPSG